MIVWLGKAIQVLLASKELYRLIREVIRVAGSLNEATRTTPTQLDALVDKSSQTGDQRELEKAISGRGGEPTRHDLTGVRKRTENPDWN